MKHRIFILLFALMVSVYSCKKDGQKPNASLTGKWKFVESLADPGDGSGKWLPVTNGSSFELKTDGTVGGTMFSDYVTYVLTDSVTLTFKKSDTTIQHYRFSIRHDTLTMSPDGPLRCIEACGSRFKKTQ